MLATTAGGVLTVVAPFLTLAAGLGGVILGAALQRRTAREQWLRDRRLDAYTSVGGAFVRLAMTAQRSADASKDAVIISVQVDEEKRRVANTMFSGGDRPVVDDREVQRAADASLAAKAEFDGALAEFDVLVMRVRAVGSPKAIEAVDILDRFVHDNVDVAGWPAQGLTEPRGDLSSAYIAAIRGEV